MTTKLTGTAPMTLVLEWDGTDQELIDFVDFLSYEDGEGLDSLDLGDAMGWVITQTMFENSEMTKHDSRTGHTLKSRIDFDSFSWVRE